MTTDDALHLIGTRMVHQIPMWAFMIIGLVLDNQLLTGVGMGIGLVLIAGNMRAQAPDYRWRVEK
jgi:hypothetical protein